MSKKQRTATEDQVAELLRTAKASLGLGTAFLSRLDGTTQHLEVVESAVPLLFPEGVTQRQSTSLCQAVLDGALPPVVPDLARHPAAMRLPAAWVPRIRSFVSVPVRLSDGSLYGTFCAAGLSGDRELTPRDRALMEVLAQAAALVIEPTVAEEARRREIRARLKPVVLAGGPRVVLQPVVEMATGRRVGAEALSRFPEDWQSAPDSVFRDAHAVGLGHDLELLAIRRAAEHVTRVSGYVGVNISASTLLTGKAGRMLARLPAERILLELSEHDRVDDYDALLAALAPLRAAGMRLAVDDVGAGFSSLRHIVLTSPDVIKIDRTIVAGVGDDGVLATLVTSLVEFARGLGAVVVAEGMENARDTARLRRLGVDHGQGWFFARAGDPETLLDTYALAEDVALPAPRDAGARQQPVAAAR